MKKFAIFFLSMLFAAVSFAVELPKGKHYALTGDDGVSGKMSFSAKILDGNKKFKIIFKNAKGDWLMFWHFEPANNRVMCFHPSHRCNHELPAKLEFNKAMKFDISIASDRYAVLSVDGKELACMSLPKDKLAKVFFDSEGGRMTLDELKWQPDAKNPSRLFVGDANHHRSMLLDKVPQGDYELTFDFTPVKLLDGNGHYGFELHSAKKGDGKLQVVIWQKGFQVIRGKGNAKWLGNFPADFAGKKHTFKLKLVDSSLYEFFIDGKRVNTFETDITPGGDILIWGYKNWRFELENISIKPLTDGEEEE